MNFNLMGTLLAVSSAHDTVHIFKLKNRSGQGSSSGAGASSKNSPSGATSPKESVDSQQNIQGLDGGYDEYVETKKSNSVSYVYRQFFSDNRL
jgi:autophagy-related protein 18